MLNIPYGLRYLALLLALGVVAWASITPDDVIPGIVLWDKARHALVYAVLGFLGAWADARHPRRIFAILFVFGLAMEMFQASMGLGRSGDPLDVLANSVGIASGIATGLCLRSIVYRNR